MSYKSSFRSTRLLAGMFLCLAMGRVSAVDQVVLTLTNTLQIDVATGKPYTFALPMQGTGGLQKTGLGTLILTGTNSYSGGTTISAGTLQGNTTSLPGNIANNGILLFNQAATGIYSGVISGTGSMTKSGAGLLTIAGANTLSGGVTLAAGSVNLNNASALGTGLFTISGVSSFDNTTAGLLTLSTNNAQNWNANFTFKGTNDLNLGSGAVTMNATRVVTVANNVLTVGGTVAATKTGFGLTKAGVGTLVLTGNNSYTGTTTISAGTLQLGAGATSGSLASSSRIVNNGRLAFSRSDNITFSNLISGKGSVLQGGTGQLTLSNNNTYTGGTTVQSGVLSAGGQALGSGSLTVDGGAVRLTNNLKIGSLSGTGGAIRNLTTSNYTLTINQTAAGVYGGTIGDNSLAPSPSGTLALVKMGKGMLTLDGANTYAGGTTLQGGGISLGAATALGTGPLTIAAVSTLDNTSGATMTVSSVPLQNWNANFTFIGTNSLVFDTPLIALKGTRTVGVTAGSLTLNGVLTGDKSTTGLTKTGLGTLVLTNNNNSYLGTTTVQGGALQLGNGGVAGSVASAKIVVGKGANIVVDRSNTYNLTSSISGAGGLIVNSSGTLILSGKANSYTGATLISGERVEVTNSTALGKGTVYLNSGTLDIDSQIAGGVTALQIGGDFLWTADANIELSLMKNLQNEFIVDTLNIKGLLTGITTPEETKFHFTLDLDPSALGAENGILIMTAAKGFGGLSANSFVADVNPSNIVTFYISGNSLYANIAISTTAGPVEAAPLAMAASAAGGYQAVPEPGTWALLALSLGVIILFRLQRKRA